MSTPAASATAAPITVLFSTWSPYFVPLG